MLSFLTPELFDTLVIAVILVGVALAVVRLYADFTRPLPPFPPRKKQRPESDFEDDD